MSSKRVIRVLAVIAVLAVALLSPAGVYAGSGSHNSGGTASAGATNRTMSPAANRSSGKPVGAHPAGFLGCYRACMAGPAGGGMARFCNAACRR
jgi:hypothetical protein